MFNSLFKKTAATASEDTVAAAFPQLAQAVSPISLLSLFRLAHL